MAKNTGAMTLPVYTRIGNKEMQLGELVLPVRAVGGRLKPPTGREIVKALRKGIK